MSEPRRGYVAFLLRLWQMSDAEDSGWRASLERPQGGERLGFASLADLVAFLEKETGASSPGSERSDEEGRR